MRARVGPVAFMAAFMISSWPIVFLFTALTIACGFLYGFWIGVAMSVAGGTCGALLVSRHSCSHAHVRRVVHDATLCCDEQVFVTSRHCLANRVRQSAEANPFLLVVESRLRTEGWKLAILVRLASFPFGGD